MNFNGLKKTQPFRVKTLVKKIFMLIDESDSDDETLQAIKVLETIALRLIITRRGHHQDKPTYVQPFYHVQNNMIRFNVIVQLIRILLVLNYEDNDQLQILIGNPLYRSRDAGTLLNFAFGCCFVLTILREYILYLEGTGAFGLLSTLRDIKINGFNKKMLYLSTKQCKLFRASFHFLIIIWIRLIFGIIILIPFFLFGVRVTNKAIINGDAPILISSFLWTLSEVYAFIYILGGLLDLGAHIIILVPLYLCQLRTLIELFRRFSRKRVIDDSVIKGLNANVIRYMNNFDNLSVQIRYLFFFLFVIVSFGADTCIFLGVFIQVNSTMISYTLAIAGLFGLFAIGSVAYAAGAYLDQLYVIHGLYISILAKSKTKLENGLKALEILDRILGPYSGAKIGDSFTASRMLAVFYILENASTIMLLICNVQSLLSK